MSKEQKRPAIQTQRGWAITVLQVAGAIRESEEHGWMVDRGDPDARARALTVARQYPPRGVSAEATVAVVMDVLDSIGDTAMLQHPWQRQILLP